VCLFVCYYAPSRGTGCVDERVILFVCFVCVCVCVCPRVYLRHCTSDLRQILHYLWSRSGFPLAVLRHVMYFRFMDDAVMAHDGRRVGMSTPLQRVTSLRRRAQANAPVVIIRVLNDGGGRVSTRPPCTGCRGHSLQCINSEQQCAENHNK